MRRSAIFSVASLFFVTSLTGCSLFKKKDATSESHASSADTYSAPAYQEPAADYGAYPADSSTPQSDPYGSASSGRYHTVSKSDTLYRLARMYYNDQSRWKDIYEANSDKITDPNRIFVGQRLVIP